MLTLFFCLFNVHPSHLARYSTHVGQSLNTLDPLKWGFLHEKDQRESDQNSRLGPSRGD